MRKNTKKIGLGLIGVVVIFILIMTWLYPYSFFSLYKSYSFQNDPVVVDGYVHDLKEFKDSYEKDLDESTTETYVDLTIDRTQYLLPLFEQNWLVSKEPAKMGKRDLGNILFEVKNARKTLLELLAQKDFTQEQRYYLVDTIESLLSLEEEIVDLKTGSAASRKTLKIQFHNLHGSFMSSFMMFQTFYERSKNV